MARQRLHFLTMKDDLDLKLLGMNSGVLAAVTLADIQTILEVVLITVSLMYTAHRYYRFLKNKNNKDDNGKQDNIN